jgi:anti-anti-sigma regulatory factor
MDVMSHFVRKAAVEPVTGGFVLRLTGPVDAQAAALLAESRDVLAAAGKGAVAVDFSDVPYVDAAGLALCGELVQELRPRGLTLEPCPASLAQLIAGELAGPRTPKRGSRRFSVAWTATLATPSGADWSWHRFAVKDAGMGGLRMQAAGELPPSVARGVRAILRVQSHPLEPRPLVFEVRVVHADGGAVGVEITETDPETLKRFLKLLAASCPGDALLGSADSAG